MSDETTYSYNVKIVNVSADDGWLYAVDEDGQLWQIQIRLTTGQWRKITPPRDTKGNV